MRKLVVVSFVVALGACTYEADGPARLRQMYGDAGGGGGDGGGGGGTIDLGNPQCSGITGRWAVRLVQQGTVNPTGVAVWNTTTIDLFLGTIGAGAASLDLGFCDEVTALTTTDGKPVSTGASELTDATRAALASAPVIIGLPGDATFASHDQVWLWGLRNMTDPLHDALPTKDDYTTDPHVWDQDGDGKPGVTIHVLSPAGYRYMVKRAVWTFGAGALSADGAWITGPLTDTIEESALGADPALLATAAPITPVAAGTVYQMRCVGETYTCAALRNDQTQLFSEAP